MLYPTVSALMTQAEIDRSLDALLAAGASDASSSTGGADAPADEGAASVGHATHAEKAADATYQQLAAYNERVGTGEGGAVNDPFAFDSDALTALGLPDDIVGKIDIPAMGVTIPLYLGATEAHMVDGAGVVAGTSVPPASLVADALTQLTPDLTSDSPLLTLEGVLRLIGLGVLMALGATLVGQALRRRRRRTRLGTREGAPGDAPGRTLTRSSSRAGDGEPPRPAGGHFKT